MKVYQTNEIRNVAVIGSGRAGKTTLAESMLFEGGVINRRGTVEDKNTVSDYKEIELERQSSVYATLMYTEFKNHKINILDCPGFDDFVGEVVASMHVTDASLLVLNAHNGVEVGAELVWRQATRLNAPTVLVVNQLEHEKANFDETVRQATEYFGSKVTILQFPVNAGTGFNTVIDIVKQKQLVYKTDGKYDEQEIPADLKAKAEDLYAKLVEAAAESDETLLEKFFEEGTLSEQEIRGGLKAALTNRGMFPVVCVSAKQNLGTARLLEFIIDVVAAPNEHKELKTTEGKDIVYDANGAPQLFVFKTSTEQHIGEISYFKVTNGAITESLDMVNSKNDGKERISQVFVTAGKNRVKVDKIVAGDLGITIKLKDTKTGHTLCGVKNAGEQIMKMSFPQPKFRTAIRAKNQADEEKLGGILKQLSNEDPTLFYETSLELKQTILGSQGELHANVVKWLIEHNNKFEIEYYDMKIPYRETITKSAKSMYRHKKQSGGSGQFGEVHMLVHPYVEGAPAQTEFPVRGTDEHALAWGGKLVYNNCIVGGAIDARFMPAILKGIMEKMEEGPLTGSYARDIVVNIYDGKMHPVDSNEISFKLAGRQAFREAFKNAGPKILEPIYDLEVVCPEETMGSVMTDLQGRRAVIMGMEGEGDGRYQRIKAKIPLAEMNRYSTSLSAITSGRGTYGMKYAEYLQVPADVQDKLLKAYEAQEKEEE